MVTMRLGALAVSLFLLAGAGVAHAQSPPAAPVVTAPDLIRDGAALESAGRYDEALDKYEEARTFGLQLGDAERQSIAQAISRVASRAGRLAVSSNVPGGVVVIDGRARGRLPFTTPIHALVGARRLRVVKEGYVTFDATIQVRAGETSQVDARLDPLAEAGRLRVELSQGVGGVVTIDGVPLGEAPWEGSLAPGAHVVRSEKGDTGSAPTVVVVVRGQTTTLRLEAKALGASSRVDVAPATARLELDGVGVGVGSWEGRLPIGEHTARATFAGYIAETRTFTVSADATAGPSIVVVHLAVDRADPRWRQATQDVPSGPWGVTLHGGYLAGGTLRSDAEGACPAHCASNTRPDGAMLGVRGAYHLPSGLAVEIGVGYFSARTSFARAVRDNVGASATPVNYTLLDTVTLQGPYAALGASWNQRVIGPISFVSRLTLGAIFASSGDTIAGAASTGTSATNARVTGSNDTVDSVAPFVHPTLGVRATAGSFQFGISIGPFFVARRGPELPHGALFVSPACSTANATAPGCLPESTAVAHERAYGPFVLWVPQIEIGYRF